MIDRYGGSISAEHGIGRVKQKAYLARADAVSLELVDLIKDALDPSHILSEGADSPRSPCGRQTGSMTLKLDKVNRAASFDIGCKLDLARDHARGATLLECAIRADQSASAGRTVSQKTRAGRATKFRKNCRALWGPFRSSTRL
ncbi:FAD-linked oxidase C-terminal domain-containing protein [Rhizobium sp. 2YAF20]|uniref:FAD-linked oxidase C-terminal domain-containing protein n=1 Tax=Rhizobium sp. 2YAF20 TaxID=3233027 RepID=UPI003F9D8D5D